MAKNSGSTKKSTSSSPKGLSGGSSQSVSMADVIKAKFEYSGGGYYDLRGKGFKGRVVATTGYDYGSTVYEASATVKGETVSLGDFKTLSKATKAVKDYIKQNLK